MNLRRASYPFAALLLALVMVGCSPAKALNLETFYIPSESNEPTLEVNDVVATDTLGLDDEISNGWFIVFDTPPTLDAPNVDKLIKRVVAGPGDTVEARDGDLYVNDELVNETYLKQPHSTLMVTKMTLPENQFYVLGDNRYNSEDSRYFGPIDRDLITHHATRIIKPSDRATDLP